MNSKVMIGLSLGLALFLIPSCQNQDKAVVVDSAKIVEQVRHQVDAFHSADTARNSKAVVDLLWEDFIMLVDGNYIGYEEVKTGSKAFMATLKTFHTEWNDLRIIPLGNQHAISSFLFTDSLVAKDGTITQSRGPNTFVWEKRNGKWKVIYGDADHYPIK